MLILAELHDFRRFQSPRALMAYLGLVPGEDSSGEKHRRGRITRTGNALVRRLLVETAWHYQHRPGVGVALTRRRKGQPGRVSLRSRTRRSSDCVGASDGWPNNTSPRPRSRWRSRASWPASSGRRSNRRRRRRLSDTRASGRSTSDAVGDGPRRRRMIRGTIVRIGELAMRYGHPSQLATSRLHVLPTKHCHVCSAAGDRGNHRISA